MQTELSPIVLFVYNRPDHTLQTLKSLENNELAKDSILYVYADGAPVDCSLDLRKQIEETRNIIKKNWLFKEIVVIERQDNFGLAKNIVDGVGTIVANHGKVIVLEDDIITSAGFLRFMNSALEIYQHEEKVMHISGYMLPIKLDESNLDDLPDTFFYNQTSCWGWATWKRAWDKLELDAGMLMNKILDSGRLNEFNMDGSYPFMDHLQANADNRMKTWAIKWHSSVFLNNGLCLHPKISLTRNIGFDGTGENCGVYDVYLNQRIISGLNIEKVELIESTFFRKKVIDYNLQSQGVASTSYIIRIKNRIKGLFK